MPVFTADAIYTPTGWIKDQVLATDQEGTIQSIRTIDPADKVIRFKGVLVPGFINAHCHLELSHLHGHIPAGLGMVPFIQEVIKSRGSHEQEEQQAAVLSALSYSHKKGIVGIGDISNSGLSAKAKRNHPVRTQTFIELLGLIPEKAEEIIEGGHKLKEAFQGLAASLTLHAPYSVSKKLIQNVYQASSERMSVHLLESAAEVALFESGAGPFVDFYQKMGLPLPSSKGKDPITYLSGVKPSERDVIWVHLTEASAQQLLQIRTQFQNSWFCLCPRSNLYLHNKLPYLPHFLAYANRICLGTDSLASNEDLNVWKEAVCLKQAYPELTLHQLVSWLSIQGAHALGMQDTLGDFSPGKNPGINLIHISGDQPDSIDQTTRVEKIL